MADTTAAPEMESPTPTAIIQAADASPQVSSTLTVPPSTSKHTPQA